MEDLNTGIKRLRDQSLAAIEEVKDAALKAIDHANQDKKKAEQQRDEILDAMCRCYKMLLSEPDTKGALFKAENILREAISEAKEK